MYNPWGRKPKSTTEYILLGLIPYTEPNAWLAFKPNMFFDELERLSDRSRPSLRATYYRAKQKKLFDIKDGSLVMSLKARHSVQPFVSKKLPKGSRLLVIFDIPEASSNLRNKLRWLLKQLDFVQVQQSVWASDKDHRKIMKDTIEEYGLNDFVQLYEANRLK